MRISQIYSCFSCNKIQTPEDKKIVKPTRKGIIAFRASGNRNHVAIITAECAPYAITGGAGSVMQQRSSFFNKMYPQKDVRIFMPFYNPKNKNIYKSTSINNPLTKEPLSFPIEKTGVETEFEYGVKTSKAELYKIKNSSSGVPVYLVYAPEFNDFLKEYDQRNCPHWKKYNIFSKAVSALIEKIGKSNEKFDPGLIHAVDSSASFLISKNAERPYLYESTDAHRESDSYISPFEAMLNIFSKKQIEEIKNNMIFKDSIAELVCKNRWLCAKSPNITNSTLVKEKLNSDSNFYSDILVEIADNYKNLSSDLKNKLIIERINNIVRQMTKSSVYYDSNIDYSCMINALKNCDNWFVPSDDYYKKVITSKEYCSGEFGSIATLRRNNGCGIANAIDLGLYNPNNPVQVVFPFNVLNFKEGKRKNKNFIFEQFSKSNIAANKISPKVINNNSQVYGYLDKKYINEPLIVNISRYNTQLKGQDIALKAIDKVLNKTNACAIIAMPGFSKIDSQTMEKFIKSVVNNPKYAGRVVFTDSYVPVNQYFASADFSLVTSRSETCGLIGFQSMRMGAVPVSTPVGIMPTIVKQSEDSGKNATGYLTPINFNNPKADTIFAKTLLKAISVYNFKPELHNSMVRNCINYDSSYKSSCVKLNNVYNKTIDRKEINNISLNSLLPPENKHNLKILRADDINSLKKADVLVMLAHPDDEVFFTPVLKYLQEGKSVQFVYFAKGDKGAYKNYAPTNPDDLAAYRENELCNALNSLGVSRSPVKLSIEDDSLHLHKKELDDYANRIIDKVQPDVIFSFAPYGYTGHPDHKAVSKAAIDALNSFNSTHEKQIKILQPVLTPQTAAIFHDYAMQENSDSFDFVEEGAVVDSNDVIKVDVKEFEKQILSSLKCHNSQWSDQEVSAIHKFYIDNPAELQSVTSIDDKNEKYENPWNKRAQDIKKLYGDEFFNIFNGIKMVNTDLGIELDLYLTYYDDSNNVDNTTMWINTDLFNDAQHRNEVFDLILNSIDKIKKIPKFKKVENISFKYYDKSKKEDCICDIPLEELQKLRNEQYKSFSKYQRKNKK